MTEDRLDAPEEREARLDRRLDAALRQIAGGDGPVDMRGRVLARIAEPRRPVVPRGALLAAAATAMLLAIGAAFLLRAPVVDAPEGQVAGRVVPRAEPPPSAERPPARASGTRTAVRVAVAPRPARSPSPAFLAPVDVETDGGELVPIEVAPLAVAPMETPRWAVAPLQVEPMQIAPLAEPEPEQ